MTFWPSGVMVMVMPSGDLVYPMFVGSGKTWLAAHAGAQSSESILTARRAVRSFRADGVAVERKRIGFMELPFP